MNYKEVLKEHGTDIEVTLLRFCQDEKLYKRFLERFFRGENVERIREICKDEKYQELEIAAHTYKGVCGNLGLSKLQKYFEEIREKIRKENYENLEELIEKALKEKKELGEELEKSRDWY